MKIQKRRVNSQDHTIGYKIGGKWYTRSQAIDLAMNGRVDRVFGNITQNPEIIRRWVLFVFQFAKLDFHLMGCLPRP